MLNEWAAFTTGKTVGINRARQVGDTSMPIGVDKPTPEKTNVSNQTTVALVGASGRY